MMKSHRHHHRMLLQMYDARGGDGTVAPPSLAREREPTTTVQNATSSSASLPSNSPSAFDSSMALIIFVLLIALFFMGFFSVYIRHFADDSTAEISPRRSRRSSRMSPRRPSLSASRPFDSRKGLDSQVVRSLPVHRYSEGAKQRIEDCVICLSDFEEGEAVKEIPYCGHVFHVPCLDTWLSSHVSCPFCRGTQMLSDKTMEMRQEEEETSDRGSGGTGSSRRSRSTVESDTCVHVEVGLRRSCSCSSVVQRVGVERSLSF